MLISYLCRLRKSLNEIRQEIKEADRLRLKEWSEDQEKRSQAEETAAASARKTASGAPTGRPTPALKKTIRKDNSPVKVLNFDPQFGLC